MTKENCSFIIVNYNSGDHVCSCVKTIFQHAPEAEVIVVDNASLDNSISLLQTSCPNQSRLKIIQNQTNRGFAVACNLGTQQATENYLFYLNPDCMIYQETIPRLLSCLQEDSSAGMAGGRLVNANGSEQPGSRRMIPTPWRTLVRVFRLSKLSKRYPRLFVDFNLHLQAVPESPIEVEAISGACMLVPRHVFDAVGGLDEEYFLHCEDLDWCMRFRLEGWKIFFVPGATLTHFQGACSRARPVFVEWHKHKGMLRFYRKFFRHQYPGVLMWLVTAAIWFRFGLLSIFHTIKRFFRWLKNAIS